MLKKHLLLTVCNSSKIEGEGSTAQNSSAPKKLLDTKILTAQHCSSRCQTNENCSKIKKNVIATARQKHWKMSTALIIKNWKSVTCKAVRLKNYKNWKSGTCTAVWQ